MVLWTFFFFWQDGHTACPPQSLLIFSVLESRQACLTCLLRAETHSWLVAFCFYRSQGAWTSRNCETPLYQGEVLQWKGHLAQFSSNYWTGSEMNPTGGGFITRKKGGGSCSYLTALLLGPRQQQKSNDYGITEWIRYLWINLVKHNRVLRTATSGALNMSKAEYSTAEDKVAQLCHLPQFPRALP